MHTTEMNEYQEGLVTYRAIFWAQWGNGMLPWTWSRSTESRQSYDTQHAVFISRKGAAPFTKFWTVSQPLPGSYFECLPVSNVLELALRLYACLVWNVLRLALEMSLPVLNVSRGWKGANFKCLRLSLRFEGSYYKCWMTLVSFWNVSWLTVIFLCAYF